ncbi:MAG: hypothetical protein R3D29_05835 [Nitratireductor sp.]
MELLSVIRRWHFRDKFSIRDISRRTGLSQNTIRKHLRSDGVEPTFKVPDRPSKLDPFADRLSAWLKTEAKPCKQKCTLKQLHADLLSLVTTGHIAGCRLCPRMESRLAENGKRPVVAPSSAGLRTRRGIPIWTGPEDWAIIGNERTKLQVAHTS